MLCVATVSADVVHAAMRLLPLPESARALQPLIVAPSLVKATLPVGAVPATVAVNVTLAPDVDGFFELATLVVVADFTVCDSGEFAEVLLEASPLYVAVMLCTPAASAAVAQGAVRVLPEPVRATALQSVVLESLNVTEPVGLVPVTVAVNVTLWLTLDGLTELASVVVVALLAPTTTCTLNDAADPESTLMVTGGDTVESV